MGHAAGIMKGSSCTNTRKMTISYSSSGRRNNVHHDVLASTNTRPPGEYASTLPKLPIVKLYHTTLRRLPARLHLNKHQIDEEPIHKPKKTQHTTPLPPPTSQNIHASTFPIAYRNHTPAPTPSARQNTFPHKRLHARLPHPKDTPSRATPPSAAPTRPISSTRWPDRRRPVSHRDG